MENDPLLSFFLISLRGVSPVTMYRLVLRYATTSTLVFNVFLPYDTAPQVINSAVLRLDSVSVFFSTTVACDSRTNYVPQRLYLFWERTRKSQTVFLSFFLLMLCFYSEINQQQRVGCDSRVAVLSRRLIICYTTPPSPTAADLIGQRNADQHIFTPDVLFLKTFIVTLTNVEAPRDTLARQKTQLAVWNASGLKTFLWRKNPLALCIPFLCSFYI